MRRKYGRNLGQTIRAWRLGYHWSVLNDAWVRIWVDDETIVIDVAPGDRPLVAADVVYEHVAWWEDDNPSELLASCPALMAVGVPDCRLRLFVDESGDPVKSPLVIE